MIMGLLHVPQFIFLHFYFLFFFLHNHYNFFFFDISLCFLFFSTTPHLVFIISPQQQQLELYWIQGRVFTILGSWSRYRRWWNKYFSCKAQMGLITTNCAPRCIFWGIEMAIWQWCLTRCLHHIQNQGILWLLKFRKA